MAAREYIEVSGTKNKAAKRKIPTVIHDIPKPALAYKQYNILFKKAVKEKWGDAGYWTLYDARRAFAAWCQNAGIPRTRRLHYMGHSLSHINDKYAQHSVEPHLWEDGEMLRAYIQRECKRKVAVLADRETQTRTRTPLVIEFD